LYDGLFELRNEVAGYLWVDALCIDQRNLKERASQVILMRDIYSSAKRVIVWLGKDTPEAESAVWLIDRYLPTTKEEKFAAQEVNYELLHFLEISKQKWFKLWESHGHFYRRHRWFSRAWVFQEFILAQEITMRCGNKTLEWEALTRLIVLARTTGFVSSLESQSFTQLVSLRHHFANGLPSEILIAAQSTVTGAKKADELWYANLDFLASSLRA
jgi:hypothetical protein